jgi:hypothetical protein
MTSTKRSTTTTTTTGSITNMRRNITTANSFFKEQFDRATAPTHPSLLNNRAACLRSFVFDLIIVILVVVFFF